MTNQSNDERAAMNGRDMAFPVLDREQTPNNTFQLGLTKRELFAAIAMQGWLAGCRNAYSEFTGPNTDMAAKAAVTFADALLAALEKTP